MSQESDPDFSDRIVTPQMIRELIERGQTIRIVRSGVYGVLGHSAEIIADACAPNKPAKDIRIILPSLTNTDVVARAEAAQQGGAEVLKRLALWHEALAQTAAEVPPPHHVELRTTEQPHRYHAVFSDSEGIVGIAWHHRAAMTTTSFDVSPTSRYRKWVLGNLIEDFDWLWGQSHVYKPGDNKKRLAMGISPVKLDPVLRDFGKALPNVMRALRIIKRHFPGANGNGATKESLAVHLGSHPNDCNQRMLDMERAGLLYKLGGNGSKESGRLLTRYGESVLKLWLDAHPEI